MNNHRAGDGVAVRTASGHHVTQMNSAASSIGLDRRDDRLIGDVIADDWVYPTPPPIAPAPVSDSGAVDRRRGVILL